MLKSAIIGLNVIALLTINYFFNEDVTISQKLPNEIKAGESFLIEITIDKGDRQGFAKWQQKLPLGFIAEPKETEGATFSFKGQEVKLIWMALPKKEEFTISYEIMTDPLMEGKEEIKGKFSYIEKNERKDIESQIKTISIVSELSAGKDLALEDTEELNVGIEAESNNIEVDNISETNSEKEAEDTLEKESNEIPTSAKESKTKIEPGKSTNLTDKNPESIEIDRKIEHLGEAKYKVTLELKKGNLNDFGKVEEYLPPNFTAIANDTEEGIFSLEKNVAKILWMRIPSKESLSVSYYLESQSEELDSAEIHGVFSFLENEESKQIAVKGSRFKNHLYESEEELAESIEQNTDKIENELDNDVMKEKIAPDVIKQENTALESESTQAISSNENELKKDISNVPSPQTTVIYRVQIAAGKKEVKPEYFRKKHNISETISTEYHKEWYKYTIGSYDVYRKARDKRNELWQADNKINDAFVTAYNSGERISVQEALMISKQKWFK